MAVREEQFDDPQLKAAVQKAFGAERASPALRVRILRAVQTAAIADTPVETKATRKVQRPAWIKYAVAAMVLLGIFAAIENYMYWEPTPKYDPSNEAYSLPINYRDDMIAAHGAAVAGELTTRDAAETKLTQQLGHKVIVPEFPGWTFKGAQAVTVAGQPGARAVYQREGSVVSLFSIVSGSYGMPDGVDYDQTCGNIAIAGIVRNGMIYCVFTSPQTPETINEVHKLRDSFSKGL